MHNDVTPTHLMICKEGCKIIDLKHAGMFDSPIQPPTTLEFMNYRTFPALQDQTIPFRDTFACYMSVMNSMEGTLPWENGAKQFWILPGQIEFEKGIHVADQKRARDEQVNYVNSHFRNVYSDKAKEYGITNLLYQMITDLQGQASQLK